ncbi:MAG: phosphotransferase [Acholeplasmataceae bacterium]|nr:phosphotransferase [Acholeplasmataceae bacterium]
MFEDIPSFKNWLKIEKINRGYSSEQKFYIETHDHQRLILRISDIANYEQKKKEFEVIQKFFGLGFLMSKPIEIGICNNSQHVYLLLSWIDGNDLEIELPKLSQEMQYTLGRKAGEILKKIHSLEVSASDIPQTTKIQKKIRQIELYENSSLRISGDEIALDFVKKNIFSIWSKPPVYLHGDFHPGNLILTENKEIGVIDFNRYEIGDPYEEFNKLESFGTEVSIPYCIGQIDSYFNNQVPNDFWEILAIYVAHTSLYSIKWAESYGLEEIRTMTSICRKSFAHYNDFKSIIPSWYPQKN